MARAPRSFFSQCALAASKPLRLACTRPFHAPLSPSAHRRIRVRSRDTIPAPSRHCVQHATIATAPCAPRHLRHLDSTRPPSPVSFLPSLVSRSLVRVRENRSSTERAHQEAPSIPPLNPPHLARTTAFSSLRRNPPSMVTALEPLRATSPPVHVATRGTSRRLATIRDFTSRIWRWDRG